MGQAVVRLAPSVSQFAASTALAADLSDEAILASVARGEAHAWRAFHGRFHGLIQRCIGKVLRRFSSIVSGDDLAEVTGVFYLALLANDSRKLRSFDPNFGPKASSWVAMLATHAAYDHLRKLRREGGKEELDDSCQLACSQPSAYDLVSERQHAAQAATTLASFSAKDREFAELYFGEGQAPEAIAERLQISVKTVYSKKHKIQSKLGAILAHEMAMAA